MENTYDMSLFSELGDLFGHDTEFYEEYDASSYDRGVSKQFYHNTSPDTLYMESKMSTSATDPIQTLLDEGNILLDSLMTEGDLDLNCPPINLEDVDELLQQQKQVEELQFYSSQTELHKSNELFSQDLSSPVSTLASEPSSPVDLFDLASGLSSVPGGGDHSELDCLLKSLLNNDAASHDNVSGCDLDYGVPESPQASTDVCYLGSSSFSEYSDADSPLTSWEDSPAITYTQPSSTTKLKTSKKKSKSTPYSLLPKGRKEKKKLQNKEAAIRYRQKKKNETAVLVEEEDDLLMKNGQLRSEVQNLEREIMCMKELLSDVFNIHSF